MIQLLAILVLLLAPAASLADGPSRTVHDPMGDAVLRRTDPGADGPLNCWQGTPDLLCIKLSRWSMAPGQSDPFLGSVDAGASYHLFRLDLTFKGLVNPPGRIPVGGGDPSAPFVHGPTPLYGFVEINVDHYGSPSGGLDTGGDLTDDAASHYLANVGRFGGKPAGPIADRAIYHTGELDTDFMTTPQYELSGAEFVFKLCGCEAVTIVSTSQPGQTTFAEGDTWVVRGHMFERASGFRGVSLMLCPPQEYTPLVSVRFSHSTMTNNTTVSLVYALDQEGARQLAQNPVAAPADRRVGLNCTGSSDEGSVFEALSDIIAGVASANEYRWEGVDKATRAISEGWLNHSPGDYLDPTRWRLTALVGTTYSLTISSAGDNAKYVWTDVYPSCPPGDQNGDGSVNATDRAVINSYIRDTDGGRLDMDQAVNRVVKLPMFGRNFDLADLDYNGLIDCHDLAIYGGVVCCTADWNRSGALSVQDLFDFLRDWFDFHADINGSGGTTVQDLFDYLGLYFAGCG